MDQHRLTTLGERIFGFSILCFGLHEIAFASGVTKVAPGPPWGPNSAFIAFATGIVLTVGGVAILINRRRSFAASMLAVLLFLRAASVYVPGLLRHIRDPGNWTAAFELLALCSAALALGGSRPGVPYSFRVERRMGTVARYVFAVSILVFAVQHFIYAAFIAELIPAWCPFHLFFAWFVGVAFAAATLAIVVRRVDGVALRLLGAMFLLWVIILHLPRTLSVVRDGNEWTSTLVALAFCGASWTLSSNLSQVTRWEELEDISAAP